MRCKPDGEPRPSRTKHKQNFSLHDRPHLYLRALFSFFHHDVELCQELQNSQSRTPEGCLGAGALQAQLLFSWEGGLRTTDTWYRGFSLCLTRTHGSVALPVRSICRNSQCGGRSSGAVLLTWSQTPWGRAGILLFLA